MRSLREIFEDHAHYGSDAGHADKGSTHSYIEEYERLLAPYRTECSFMEIGLAMGESLKMWKKYFHKSRVVGVDISIMFSPEDLRSRPGKTNNDNVIHVIEWDATKPDFIKRIEGFRFDVIIDDASHQTEDQIATFNLLKPIMNKNGIYIIEDILALDQEREKYLALHDNCEIIDLRHVKGRFDDVLICYKF